MRTSLILLTLVLLIATATAGCVAGANPSQGTATENHATAGFWLGLWHGFIAPFTFLISLFKASVGVYEAHNNGAWYNFGFLFGLACIFGRGGHRAARHK